MERSREALSEFLDYLANKGLMAKATVQARKAAASKILGILEADEATDVTILDLDDVVSRFQRLYAKNYTPQSLVTYKSRLGSAIEDFRNYLSNPLAFRPALNNRERPTAKSVKEKDDTTARESKPEAARPHSVPAATSNILPIPIRADLTIYVQGLPYDLNVAEAKKIAAVITAMAQS